MLTTHTHTHTQVSTYFLKHMQHGAVDMVGVFAGIYMFMHMAKQWKQCAVVIYIGSFSHLLYTTFYIKKIISLLTDRMSKPCS